MSARVRIVVNCDASGCTRERDATADLRLDEYGPYVDVVFATKWAPDPGWIFDELLQKSYCPKHSLEYQR